MKYRNENLFRELFFKRSTIKVLILSILFIQSLLTAQTTGSFTKTVQFGGARTLAYYVPTTYSSATKYKLVIGLHGSGGNGTQYRNSIQANSTASTSPLYNCIIVCPDGNQSTPDKNFYSPWGYQEIIRVARDSTIKWYNIDTTNIYLNGFSLGGRSALKYGLDNYKLFKGLFLWTPAVQSIADVENKTSFQYNYSNAKKIPICMTVGDQDYYVNTVKRAYNIMLDSNAAATLNIIAGMGHTLPPQAQQFGCMDFAGNFFTNMPSVDAGLHNLKTASDYYYCSSNVAPSLIIQNRAKDTLKSATISYSIDAGSVNNINWTGKLPSLSSESYTLPSISLSSGTHKLKVWVKKPNGITDMNIVNDTVFSTFGTMLTGVPLPLAESFENTTLPGWMLNNPDGYISWMITNTAGKTGASSLVVNNYDYVITGAIDESIIYPIDLSSAVSPVLSFWMAYQAYADPTLNYKKDTLEVLISTDCGATYKSLYKKYGASLITATPAFSTTRFVPASDQWRNEIIPLNSSASFSNVRIKFRNTTGYQNMLYIDDINISNSITTGVSDGNELFSANVFPNPGNGKFELMLENIPEKMVEIEVHNLAGQLIYKKLLETGAQMKYVEAIDLSGFENGLYLMKLMTGDNATMKKILINH
ncbi:MAG: choice-of-anchor J domain-containing protein [Bacteroidetes bacterium]|nr:choice-of-anchor J domain-containing protein [Bacteroidota bacterium]